MIKLDDDLLQELGLASLPAEEKKKLLAFIYETLEMRVGMKLAERMSDAQLTEFEQFIDRNDEAGALHWLETNFPDYKDVVASEFDLLKKEITQDAPRILAASNNQAPAGMPGAAQPQQPMMQAQPMQPMQSAPPVMPPQPWPNEQSQQPAVGPAPSPWPQQSPQMPQYPQQPQPQPPQSPFPQQPGQPGPYAPGPQPVQPPQQPGQRDDYDLAG